MKKMFVVVMALGVIALASCVASPTSTPKKSGAFRVGFASEADFGDLPSLLAHEVLRAQGYTVETQFFASADLEVAALTQGALDLGNGSTRTHWNAAAKGAPIVTIMEEAADEWSLVAKQEIKTCADLNGQRTAYSSAGALSAALLKAYLGQNCPDAKLQILLIPNSAARAAALLAGELDATPLELADVLQVQQKAPDKFHTLINFAQAFPQLKTTGVHVQSDFAKQHPEQVRDYLKALLTVQRDIRANPKLVQDAAVKFLKMDPAVAATTTDAYLQNNIWDVNGGLARDAVTYSVDFFTKTGSLPEGLTADKVSDLSYLEAVLNEIGRK